MSWWDSSSITGFATQALKTAQKKIDKVLDIKEEEGGEVGSYTQQISASPSASSPTNTSSPKPTDDSENFWNSWLGGDKSSLSPSQKSPAVSSGIKSPASSNASPSARASTTIDDSSRCTEVELSSARDASTALPKRKQTPISTTSKLSEANSSPLSFPVDKEYLVDRLEFTERYGREEENSSLIRETIGQTKKTIPELSIAETKESKEGYLSRDHFLHSEHSPGVLSLGGDNESQLTFQYESNALAMSASTMEQLEMNECEWRDVSLSGLVDSQASFMHFSVSNQATAEMDISICDKEDGQIRDIVRKHTADICDIRAGEITNIERDNKQRVEEENIAEMSLDHKTVNRFSENIAPKTPPRESEEIHYHDVEKVSEHEHKLEETGLVDAVEMIMPTNDSSIDHISETNDIAGETRSQIQHSFGASGISLLQADRSDIQEKISSEFVQISTELSLPQSGVSMDSSSNSRSAEVDVTSSVSAGISRSGLLSETELVSSSNTLVSKSGSSEGELASSNITMTSEDTICNDDRNNDFSITSGTDEREGLVEVMAKSKEMCSGDEEGKVEEKDVELSLDTLEKIDRFKIPPPTSSIVTNMLEEAMFESTKDSDSRADSHSSSEPVRVESGHTSGDELETATSSDIEIISNLSGNGEYRMERQFEFSAPFRFTPRNTAATSRRSGSPPLPQSHRRTDSGSSGYSLQSRNGDEVKSLEEGRLQRSEVTRVLERQSSGVRYPKEFGRGEEERKERSEATTEFGGYRREEQKMTETKTSSEIDQFQKTLAEMRERLEAREKKLVELSRENIELEEAAGTIKNQLQQLEATREAEETQQAEIKEEFTKRISEFEKKLQSIGRERDALKKQLKIAETDLIRKSDSSANVEKLMREKDEQIQGLLQEGEKLSKQQLQNSAIIRKLRAKEKENESVVKSQKEKLDVQNSEVDRLQKILENKVDQEKKHLEIISQLNNAVKKQESEIGRLMSELEDSEEKSRSIKATLDSSFKELAEMHKANVTRVSKAQEEALSLEIQAKEELRLQLEKESKRAQQQQETLFMQMEDLRFGLSRAEKDQGRKEDMLRQEILDLQQRLQEAEDRNQELSQSVSAATRPLLRQIENIQSTYAAQSASYEKVERNLTERLVEAQSQLAVAVERERSVGDQLIDNASKIAALESQVSTLRQEKTKLTSQLQVEKSRAELLQESKNSEQAKFDSVRHNLEEEISALKKDRILIENQLEMEKIRTEGEKKKVLALLEQVRDKDLQIQMRPIAASPNSLSRGSSMAESNIASNVSHPEDLLEKSLMMSSTSGGKKSLYDSLRNSGTAATLIENLQSQLKQRDGEISQLKNEIMELERTRASMAQELVRLTNEIDNLQSSVKEFSNLQNTYTDLNQRYGALLLMYGEKVEEAQELRLDIVDLKEMYKAQIDQLLNK